MKAVTYAQYGSPDVLHATELAKPIPKPDEILVKVEVTTVTAGDSRMRAFKVPPSYWLPARLYLGIRGPKNPILGMEAAGTIEAVGPAVHQFQPGDVVIASTLESGVGAYAEYICLPAAGVIALKTEAVTVTDSVTLPVGGRTALYFLREADIQPGQAVLIYGASGSVGTFAVQLANYFGAEVTAVCSAANRDLVLSLGADNVIDYTREDFTKNGRKYDVIFDTVGKTDYAASMAALTAAGTYLQAVASPGISLRMAWTSKTTAKKCVGGGPLPQPEDLTFLQALIANGQLKPVIDRHYKLAEIAEAHRYVDTGRKKGNVIIQVAA